MVRSASCIVNPAKPRCCVSPRRKATSKPFDGRGDLERFEGEGARVDQREQGERVVQEGGVVRSELAADGWEDLVVANGFITAEDTGDL